MDELTHPDSILTLRFALWGATDGESAATARHLARCPACADHVGMLRRVRDLLRIGEGAPAAPFELRAAAAGERELDFRWLAATAVAPLAGVRSGGASASRHYACRAGDFSLELLLHRASDERSASLPLVSDAGRLSLSGQALVSGEEPLADAEVTLFLDRRPSVSARTDSFGEFVFEAGRGRRIGVRVAAGTLVRHVELPVEASQ